MKKPSFDGFQRWLRKNGYDEFFIQEGDKSEAYLKYLKEIKKGS